MVLQGTNFELRRWQLEDQESLVQNANNIKIWENLRDVFPHPYTMDEAEMWVSHCSKMEPLTEFAIAVDGWGVGGIGVIPGEDIYTHSAEIGYWLGESYWGRGIVSEAVQLIVKYAFSHLGYHRLNTGVMAHNSASRRILEKAGFNFEGTAYKAIFKNGKFIDEHRFAILNPEFTL